MAEANILEGAETERSGEQQLEEIQTEIHQRIQDILKEVEKLKQDVESLKRSACIEIKESEFFTELIRSIEKIHTEVIELIGTNEKAAVNKAEGHMKKLEQEIAEQIKNFQALCAPPEAGDLPSVTVSFGDVRKAVSGLKDHIEEIVKITAADSCQLTLDPNTAHRNLCLSEGNREVTRRGKIAQREDHQERFQWFYQVLCKESLPSTHCYWEIEWCGREAGIGVTYNDIVRQGKKHSSLLGRNDKSWNLYCSHSKYIAYHNKDKNVISVPCPSKIRVYLDRGAGTLSYYGVSDTMTLLYRFQIKFTKSPLYPVFWIGSGSTVTICQLN